MSEGGPVSERVLVLAPGGRDALIARSILIEAGLVVIVCADLDALCEALAQGAGAAVVVEEALQNADLSALVAWISCQPSWSDFPFVVLALKGGGLERNPARQMLSHGLGNVSFLERPFHPTTLVSVVSTALRGRRRQYEARGHIEEMRRAEAQLEVRVHERTAELEDANRQLASQIVERERVELALRQSQRLEAVGQLTAGVAHDFNNLLTVILGNVRFLRQGNPDKAAARRLEMMKEAAERGARLTAQMLAFSRRQTLQPRPVDLNETVKSMRDLLQSSMGGSVRIEVRLGRDLWPAMIDPTQIELVILNLAINARDAMEVGGTVTVETANVVVGAPERPEEPPAGDHVMVAVRDTGTGMTPDVLAKAFEPFFTTKEVGKGSGLGLSQVYGLAKQSGGGVSIETAPGAGTTIKVFLPRARTSASSETALAAEPGPQGDGAVVLIVDDDAAVRLVTASLLRELGYAVVEAGSGGSALQTLDERTDISLALLDYAMPGMNGMEVGREIQLRRPHLPILFATGFADDALIGLAGEDHVLGKPLVVSDLADKLSAALTEVRAPAGTAAEQTRVEGWRPLEDSNL